MIKTGTAGGCAKLKKDKAKLEQQGCGVSTHPLCSVDCGGNWSPQWECSAANGLYESAQADRYYLDGIKMTFEAAKFYCPSVEGMELAELQDSAQFDDVTAFAKDEHGEC